MMLTSMCSSLNEILYIHTALKDALLFAFLYQETYLLMISTVPRVITLIGRKARS